MKKIIFILMVLFGMNATMSATPKKLSIEDIKTVSMTIANNDSLNIYGIDMNSDFTEIRNMLGLNYAQSRDLYKIHKDITRQLDSLNTISDIEERSRRFSEVMYWWRRLSYNSIMYNTLENETQDEARMSFRVYWAIVNLTVNNKHILDNVKSVYSA